MQIDPWHQRNLKARLQNFFDENVTSKRKNVYTRNVIYFLKAIKAMSKKSFRCVYKPLMEANFGVLWTLFELHKTLFQSVFYILLFVTRMNKKI